VSPAPKAVMRQKDIVGAGTDWQKRMSRMIRSNILADANIREALQEDRNSGHDFFVIKIDYRIENNRMCEAFVEIANRLRYSRQGMELQATAPGDMQFNWIATIPLCFKKYQQVIFVINNHIYIYTYICIYDYIYI